MTKTNAEIMARRHVAVPRGVSHATALVVETALDGEVWDVEGNRFIDFAGGIGVLNVGHRHPRIIEAAKRQLDRFTHPAFQVSCYEQYVELAERLNDLAPFRGPAKTVFFTTGAEAVENAIKIARISTGRSGVISFSGAFHGRTLLALAATGKVAPYKKQIGPLPGEVYHLPFPISHQGVSVSDTMRALDNLFCADIESERVAAIILEPVQGEGGFYIAETELLLELRQICDRFGILLIADEVQSGFGRTGRMFGIEHSGVEPDLVTVAKSLAGGFPLSGVIGREDIMDRVEPGGLGGTFGGNPVACAAALAVLDVIEDEKLLDRAALMGVRIKGWFAEQALRNDTIPIGAIRGRGAMVAFEVFADAEMRVPSPKGAAAVAARALQEGVIILTCGNNGNVLRFLAPLTMPSDVLDEGLAKLGRALTAPAGAT